MVVGGRRSEHTLIPASQVVPAFGGWLHVRVLGPTRRVQPMGEEVSTSDQARRAPTTYLVGQVRAPPQSTRRNEETPEDETVIGDTGSVLPCLCISN
jgi:hypothetical protein